ncbi:hypothetical protein [Streptomyces bobili]|uniref:hypothetical protein n=1 Tax=Streptomyces bobili TaxID=67280 RepID=UPI0037182872
MSRTRSRTRELIRTWHGDHTRLLLLLADQLTTADQEVAAEAAAVLESCHRIAAPAREALAAHIDAQRAAHGPHIWAAPDALLRRSHQEAVRALARLGDVRRVSSRDHRVVLVRSLIQIIEACRWGLAR